MDTQITIERESSWTFPPTVKQYLGFNTLEASKHRKRNIGNLSSSKLTELSLSLKESLHGMVFSKSDTWALLKIESLKLATVMDDYLRHLGEIDKKC